MSKVINPHGTCIHARAVGRQQVLGDLVLSSGLTMSPLDGNRTEALTRGFDLRKVCRWERGLVERGQGTGGEERHSHCISVSCHPLSSWGCSENSTLMCFHQKFGVPAHTLPGAHGDNKSHHMEYCEELTAIIYISLLV